MENIKGKYANTKRYHLDASEIAIAEASVKKIPVLGAVYNAANSVGTMLHNAFPSVFDTTGSIQTNLAAKFDSQVYNSLKDNPLFVIGFSDPNFTIPMRYGPGTIFMFGFPNENDQMYKAIVSLGNVIDGVGTKPVTLAVTGSSIPPFYPIFPNILSKTLNDLHIASSGSLSSDVKLLNSNNNNPNNNINTSNPNLILIVGAVVLLIIILS
jgi:hypothetical protein